MPVEKDPRSPRDDDTENDVPAMHAYVPISTEVVYLVARIKLSRHVRFFVGFSYAMGCWTLHIPRINRVVVGLCGGTWSGA